MATTELIETEAELKQELFRRIESIHDLDELRKLFTYIDETHVYVLTPEERRDIEEGIRQSEAGLGIPHEVVRAEVLEWARTKK